MRHARTAWMVLGLCAAALFVPPAAGQSGSLSLKTPSLPSATVGSPFAAALEASGGAQPYSWHLATGSVLPPGLVLHSHSGTISGTSSKPGEYRFSVVLADSGIPAQSVQREFTIVVVTALTIDWRRAPRVSGNWLSGSIVVGNHLERTLTVTVIVVGVNQIGRATALGYRRLELAAGSEQEIPFGASPGPGSYVVHADVVAEGRSGAGGRARKQTPDDQPLIIQQM